MKTKVVILLSGGLDSTTVLYYALSKGFDCHCIIFDYNQRHKKEINIAKKIATAAKAKYKVIKLDLNWNKTSLIGKDKKIPNHKTIKKGYIPTTYVPGRNTIFLSNALAYAETIKAKYIFLGINMIYHIQEEYQFKDMMILFIKPKWN